MSDQPLDGRQEPVKVVGTANLARNTGFFLGADLTFALGRMLTFFLLGNSLGAAELGRYVAVLGLSQLILPVSTWGISHVMVRNYTRGRPFPTEWAKATTVNIGGGLIGSLVVVLLAQVLFDVSPETTLLIALAQVVGLALQQAGVFAAAAQGRTEIALAINGANTLFRVTAILIFYFALDTHSLNVWARFLAVAMIGGSVATLLIVRRYLGGTIRAQVPDRHDLRLGAGFVFVGTASTAQADIDKVVLGGFGLDVDAGVYAAAYRVVDLANLPLGALVGASYSEFFRRGSTRIADAVQYARKLTVLSVSYGLVVGVALWLTAPLLEVLMGSEFEDSVTALRWLAIVPAIRAAQFFPANVLSGIDRQWVRARLMTGTAVLNLVSNIVLVPDYGWRGAAASTVLAEAVFGVGLWAAVFRELRAERASDSRNNHPQ